ncbi:hypothetical protein [Roseburia sp. 499]|uniref:hypothetical protein n=1 Tax=Roseburia sp. 499 TaxID=1261634 RepID=UPI0009511635|nr:hypothetical protein [Roseburia sp. 499]WVK68859.1 hypothetical protein BIV20_10760 [Roseburia sp. 499]
METRQYGDTVCIHFFIKPFQIEGVIRKVKRVKRKKTYYENTMENMLEQQTVWNKFERNRNSVQEMLQMRERF